MRWLLLDSCREVSFLDNAVVRRRLSATARLAALDCFSADALALLLDVLRMYSIAEPIFLLMKARRTGMEVATIVMALSAADQITDLVASSTQLLAKERVSMIGEFT